MLDLCTGSGCIPLLFHSEFYFEDAETNTAVDVIGVDVSNEALKLARENLVRQIAYQASKHSGENQRTRSLHHIGFVQGDVLLDQSSSNNSSSSLPLLQALQQIEDDKLQPRYDILICNPPYISPKSFQRTTSKSVKNHEPKLALVPSRPVGESDTIVGDFFYPRLLQIADYVGANIVLFEVADMDQARRVVELVIERGVWANIEIWRDEPAAMAEATAVLHIHSRSVKVRGTGDGRFVFAYRGEGRNWIG